MRDEIGTKIIATVGPRCRDVHVLAEMVRAGVNGFRINCSHTKADEIQALVRDLRSCGAGFIMADLAGPKLRCETKIEARAGETIELGSRTHPLNNEVEGVVVGAVVSFGDGNVAGRVVRSEGGRILVELEADLRTNSGAAVHIAGSSLVGGCIGEADLVMLEAAVASGVDWVALSYVKNGEDARRAAGLVAGRAGVIAKIERQSAYEDLAAICESVEAVMVARGDLGVELDYVQVPKVQREIFEYCRDAGMPVVCATEMLGSMLTAERPTRAEVSDVESTMRAGYDAIVLTAETAMGRDPVKVIEVAARIKSATETGGGLRAGEPGADDEVLADAAVRAAESTGAEAIVVLTSTGHTARLVAGRRHKGRVYAAADKETVARKISLYYGITSFITGRDGGVESSSGGILAALVNGGLLSSGAKCVLIGSRLGPEQDADLVMIRRAPIEARN